MSKPSKLPADRPPRREPMPTRWEARSRPTMLGKQRLAFQVERGGRNVQRVEASDPVNLSTHFLWWDDGNDASVTIVDDRMHIEGTAGLFDGTDASARKLASLLGVDAQRFAPTYVAMVRAI